MDYALTGMLIGAIIGGLVGLIVSIPLMIKQSKINKGTAVGKPGSRFTRLVHYRGDVNRMAEQIGNFLTANGYFLQHYGNENAFRNGGGMLTACKFFKYSIVPEGFFIEAFVILFGAKESGLDGFTGVAAKKPLKRIVDQVIGMIEQENSNTNYHVNNN